MILLTGRGDLANAFKGVAGAGVEIASRRELSEQAFRERLAAADVVIHNASTLKCGTLSNCVECNFAFTRSLVDTLVDLNPDAHLVYVSSMSILDAENSAAYARPEDMDPYAYSKYLGETYCLKSALKRLSCVRFSTLFYADPQKDGLSRLAHDAARHGQISLLGNGEATRDFLPLNVAAEYLRKVASLSGASRRRFTIATGTETSFAQVAAMLRAHLPALVVKSLPPGAGKPVLSRFATDDIRELGLVDFSLDQCVADYLRSLEQT